MTIFRFPVRRFARSLAVPAVALFILAAAEPPPPEIQAVERGLRSAALFKGDPTWTIEERMRFHKVPGVSIAVFGNGCILWAKAYGVADADTGQPATPATLFQAASISKPVSAMAALKEVDRGKLALEKNINEFLKSWKLPENELTRGNPVTLARLLGHTAGVTVHGFPGYAAGRALPTLEQIFNGKPPANNEPIRVDHPPGKEYLYSGGGDTIVQQAVVDVEGKPYPAVLDELVLKPLGMTQSTYEQPLPVELLKTAAAGHDAQGRTIAGKRHTYPEMAAAGLWTTPSDLARFALALDAMLAGKPGIVKKETAAKMVAAGIGDYGLGLGIQKRGAGEYFAHGGSNEGFRCELIGHKTAGYGVAIMTNADGGDKIIPEILRSIAAAYRWDGFAAEPIEAPKLEPAVLAARAGRYQISSDNVLTLKVKGTGLEARMSLLTPVELLPASAEEFLRRDEDIRYRFTRDSEGRDQVAIAPSQGETVIARRVSESVRVPADDLEKGRFAEAVAGYRRLHDANPSDPSVAEARLNGIGYAFLTHGEKKGAIALFRLNTELYPDSANTYDSLAEAHMMAGDRKQAIALYRKALELLPRDKAPEAIKENLRENALVKLKELEEK